MAVASVVNNIGFDAAGKRLNFDGSSASVIKYVSALKSLDATQRTAVMSGLGLTESQQRYVTSLLTAVPAIERMTVAELEKKLNMTQGRLATLLGAQATDRLTMSMLENAIASGKLGRGQAAMITRLMQTSVATTTATAATKGFSLSLATLKAEMLALVSTPLGLLMTLISVIPLAVQGVKKIYDVLTVTHEEAYESAQSHTQSYQDLKAELENLVSEKAEIESQISELELAGRNGQTINEEDLNRLKAMNSELTVAIAQKEKLAQIEADAADEDYAEAYKKKKFVSQAELTDGHGRTIIQEESRTYDEYIGNLIENYNELNDKRKQGIALTEQEQAALTDAEGKLLAAAVDLQDNYLANYTADDEMSAHWKDLISQINKATDEASWFRSEIDKLPDSVSDTLKEYGEASELTEERVVELVRQFPELADWMARTGISANQLASYFDTTGASTDSLTAKTMTLEEALNTLEDEFNRVEAAQNKYNAAMEQGDYDTNFKTYADAYEKLGEEIKAGTVGREFWAGAEFFFGEEQLREWEWSAEKVTAAYQKLKGVFGDADSGGFGILDKLYELERSGELVDEFGNKLMRIEKTAEGGFDFEFDSDNLDELADKLGITEEALLSCIEALQIWGDIDLYDMDDVMSGLKTDGLVMEYTVKTPSAPEIEAELRRASIGGTVDLTMRPVIDTAELIKRGWKEVDEGLVPGEIATVYSSTYSSKDGQHAINVTPILTDGNGRPMGVLTPEQLEQYAMDILAGGEDKYGIQIGATFHGEDAIQQATDAAQKIHELQAEYYGQETFDIVNLDNVRSKLSEMGMEAREIDDLISDIAADANIVSFDSQGTADDLLNTLQQIGAVTQDESGMNLVNVDAFSSFLRMLGYAEEEIESFYDKFEGRSDISLVDSEGTIVSLNKATEAATKNAKKQKGEVQKNIELFRELNKTASELDPSSDEFLAVTEQVEQLKTYFNELPDAVKQAFSIDPTVFSSGVASITETLADYEQAVLDLQALEIAQQNGIEIDQSELDAAQEKVNTLYTTISEIPDIEAKASIDLD